ncbi:MAG: hemerythrin domain-containing protein [Thermodesulfobacteriota bacterium]
MKATQQLKAEHEGITLMLRVLDTICGRMESGQPFDVGHIEKMLDFFKVFVDRCHHGKEEGLLFPALEGAGIPKEGGPIGQMLSEHEHGRALVREMNAALSQYHTDPAASARRFGDAGRMYIEFLTLHIQKENQVLFRMADQRLAEADQESLFHAFEEMEEKKIGLGTREEFHRLLDELAEIYVR